MMARREFPEGPTAAGLVRDPSLVPLSRDHHDVLVHSWALRRLPDAPAERRATIGRFLAAFNGEILGHMDDEETVLLPRAGATDPAGAQRLRDEHAEIRRLAEALRRTSEAGQDPSAIAGEIGWLLHDHVRFEERAFFEAVQRGLSAEALLELGRALTEKRSLRGRGEATCPLARP